MLRKQVLEVEGSRGAERDRQRAASRAAAMQAELKSMKMEQVGTGRSWAGGWGGNDEAGERFFCVMRGVSKRTCGSMYVRTRCTSCASAWMK